MYKYVLNFELEIYFAFKTDPFALENSMTILDLQTFTTLLTNKIKEDNDERKKQNTTNKTVKCLVALKNILNYMDLPERV